MSKIINFLFGLNRRNAIEKYLSESQDLVELERRQQDLARKGIWV